MKRIVFAVLTALALLSTQYTAAQGLFFRDSVQPLGTISEDDEPRVYKFRYENRSKQPVVILRVATTCGCTQPSYSRAPIAPGASGEVSVTFHPRGRAGALHKSLFVYTNQSAAKPAAQLALTGIVQPSKDRFTAYRFRMGVLRLKQQSIDFRTTQAPRLRVARIEVANAGERALRLSAVGLPAYIEFRTEPATIAPDSVADLVFTLRTTATDLRGVFEKEIYLEGFSEPLPPSQRTVRLKGEIE